MIIATIRMAIGPQKRVEALKILKLTAEQCMFDQGCLSWHIYGDLLENNIVMFQEIWRTKENLEAHMRSEEYLNLLLVMEMALQPPEIRFDAISSSTGIETIEKARSQAR